MDNDAKDLSKVSQKQSVLKQKMEECTNKISELGAIPNPEMISKYMAYSQKNVSPFSVRNFILIVSTVVVIHTFLQLFKELEKANSHLKKYSHVNKKALDQFMSFSEQKEKLVSRKQELDKEYVFDRIVDFVQLIFCEIKF